MFMKMDTRHRYNRLSESRIAIVILFKLILLVKSENQYNELPQLFSPRQPERFTGKIVYYEPKNVTSTESSTQVPWEDVLKETVVLTLNERDDHLSKTSPYSLKRRQKEIYRAPYKGMINFDTPKFGDIVLLAKGRLEKAENESYTFVQNSEPCDRRCFENTQDNKNVTAVWTVERIRHRDHARGHRFELKFTVVPLNEDKTKGADSGLRISKSYIVRDDDYPRYFAGEGAVTATLSKRSDRRTIFDMFDIMPLMNAFIPYTPRYGHNLGASNLRELNTGEFTPRPGGRLPAIPGGQATMTVIRLPPKVVRYPDTMKSPYSGNPMSGVHLYLNGLQQSKLPSSFKSPPITRPVFDLDKANDYSKQMEYQGSIDAKKVFPTPKEEESKSVSQTVDNTLDWKTPEPAQPNTNTGAYTLTTVFEGSSPAPQTNIQNQVQTIPQSIPQTVPHTQHYTNNYPVTSHQMTSMVFPQQVPHHVHPPISQVMFQHYPAMLVPIQNHLSPFHMPIIVSPSNSAQPDHMSTTTHYGDISGQGPVPPFTPLHHSFVRGKPRAPPKETNHGFRESQKHENHKFSIPDPLYTSASPASTAPYRNVLPSPYSSQASKAETSTATFYDNRPVHEKIEDDFVPIAPTPWKESSKTATNRPDSINAQLPAPDKGTEVKIPYVNEKTTKKARAKITSTSINVPTTAYLTTPKQSRTRSTSLIYTTPTLSTVDYSTSKYKNMYKTTDKPVLKWIPKKSRTKPTERYHFVPTVSSTSTTVRTFVTRPITTTTLPPPTTTTTTTTTTTSSTGRPTLRFTKPSTPRPTARIERVEATTMKPRPWPSTSSTSSSTTATTTTRESRGSTSSTSTSTTRVNRGRHRPYLKRRENNSTTALDAAESKTSLTQTISVEQRRRKIKRTRIQPTKLTSTSSTTLRFTTTPAPFLPTTTNEPPSTTAEIVKAAIQHIDTNSTNMLLYQAGEPNNNELDTSLTEAILQHARALHSPTNGYFYNNKKQKLYRTYDKN